MGIPGFPPGLAPGNAEQVTYIRERESFAVVNSASAPAASANGVWAFTAPGNVRALLIGTEGTPLITPVYGHWYAINAATRAVLWQYQDSGENASLLCTGGDVHGDGSYRLIVTFYQGAEVVCLRPDGTVDWSYVLPGATYSRHAAIGKLRPDIAGNQVVCTGSDGHVSLLDQFGTQIWTRQYGTDPAEQTVQAVTVCDADADGADDIYVVQYQQVARLDPANGNPLWETAIDTRPMGIASGHMIAGTGKQIIATGDGDATHGKTYCLDSTGAILWTYTAPYACWFPCCADIDGDGIDEVFVDAGTKGWEPPPFLGLAAIIMLRGSDGVELTRCSVITDGGWLAAANIYGDGLKLVLGGNDAKVHIFDVRKYGNDPV